MCSVPCRSEWIIVCSRPRCSAVAVPFMKKIVLGNSNPVWGWAEVLRRLKILWKLRESDKRNLKRLRNILRLNRIHQFYNFVKRKVCNDTLCLLCLPNTVKTELCKARNDYSAKSVDSESSSSKKGSEPAGKKNSFETGYNQQTIQFNFLPVAAMISQENTIYSPLKSCYIASPPKPPETII